MTPDRSTARRFRGSARRALESGFWKPSSLGVLARAWRGHPAPRADDPTTHLQAAADWLRRAQDVTGNGGVSWGYQLRHGWNAAYPETTGYIIPTFLELGRAGHGADFHARAGRCVEFEASVQLPTGAFPAGTLVGDRERPSVFNTGQVICGLNAWYQDTGDEAALAMARRAADWLISVQDDDGAWRRFGYLEYPVTYTSHVSCWLAELGVLMGEPRFVQAASRHIDWVLSQQDPSSGWFERAGFSGADHAARRAVTHTLAYTLWGTLHAGLALDRPDAVDAVRGPARSIADFTVSRGWLPGMLDATWSSNVEYACLTGNAQMALLWIRLRGMDSDPQLARATEIALEGVGEAQLLGATAPGLRGGIPGSDPIWGDYAPFAVPNWAAKFYLDALLAREREVRAAAGRPAQGPREP